MKTFNIHKIFRGLLCAALLTSAVACTDDHFDINDGGNVSATRTIWQNIQAEPQLSDLAALLQRVPVIKSVSDKKSSVLYSTLLDQPQTFTFWAPVNGSYDADYYNDLLDQAEEIADDSLRAVAKYRVAYQFFMNHMARFNYESNPGDQEVFLLNTKKARYNSSAATFNDIPLLAGYENIPSSNGTLHILDGFSPFYKNMHENITEDYQHIWDVLYLKDADGVYVYQQNSLDRNLSVEGAMDNKGNMVYVDSVWSSSNTLLNTTSTRGHLSDEDSTYVAVVPATEEAWQTVMNKVLPLFKYGSLYWTKWDDELGRFTKEANGLTVSSEMADSLAKDRAFRRIFQAMYISPSACGFNTEEPIDETELINYVINADTLRTTTNLVYRNPNKGGVNPMFEGKQPRKLSNGYVFELDKADIDPCYLWAPRIDFSGGANVLKTVNCEASHGEYVYLNESDRNPDVTGYLQDDSYQRFKVSSGQMQIYIKIPDVLSTSYCVKLVMAPNYTRMADVDKWDETPVIDEETGEPVIDEETGEPVMEKTPAKVVSKFVADVYYDTHRMTQQNDPQNRVNSAAVTVEVPQDEISEVVLFEKLTFNKCYYMLPTEDDSAPYIVITLSTRNQQNNNNALNIVRVILEPLPEGK